MGLSGNGALPVGVPDDNVSVRADGYDSLSRIQVEDPGGIGASDCNESRGMHYSGMHALLPEHGHPVLDTVHAVRDFREIVFTQSFLLGIERAIITADDLESISEKWPY